MDKTFTNHDLKEKVEDFEPKSGATPKLEPDENVISFLTQFSRVYNVGKVVTGMSSVLPFTMILN